MEAQKHALEAALRNLQVAAGAVALASPVTGAHAVYAHAYGRVQTENQHLNHNLEHTAREKAQLQDALNESVRREASSFIGGAESDGDGDGEDCEGDDGDSPSSPSSRTPTKSDAARTEERAQQQEMAQLRQEIGRLRRAEEESRALQDELDELKAKAQAVDKLERSVQSYKKKLEDLPALQQSLRNLEETNGEYVERISRLEQKESLLQRQLENSVAARLRGSAEDAELVAEAERLAAEVAALQAEKVLLARHTDQIRLDLHRMHLEADGADMPGGRSAGSELDAQRILMLEQQLAQVRCGPPLFFAGARSVRIVQCLLICACDVGEFLARDADAVVQVVALGAARCGRRAPPSARGRPC
jgi:hypothetical protein